MEGNLVRCWNQPDRSPPPTWLNGGGRPGGTRLRSDGNTRPRGHSRARPAGVLANGVRLRSPPAVKRCPPVVLRQKRPEHHSRHRLRAPRETAIRPEPAPNLRTHPAIAVAMSQVAQQLRTGNDLAPSASPSTAGAGVHGRVPPSGQLIRTQRPHLNGPCQQPGPRDSARIRKEEGATAGTPQRRSGAWDGARHHGEGLRGFIPLGMLTGYPGLQGRRGAGRLV